MKLRNVDALKLVAVCGALGGFGLVWALLVGRANFAQAGNNPAAIVGLPEDWTHRHVIYTDSGPAQVMAKAQQDPRYWLQQLKRHGAQYADVFNLQRGAPLVPRYILPLPSPLPRVQARKRTSVDWNMSLGGAGGGGKAGAGMADGVFPAKFTFDVNATPDCTNDFAVFAEDTSGAAPAAASGTGTFSISGQGTAGQTATITNGTNSIILTATGAYASATGTFSANSVSGGQTATITNGANSITLTASAPVAASQTGTFSASPTSATSTITITNGANVTTLKTNATSETAAGTFASAPSSNTSITIGDLANSNTLALTTNATQGSVIGTVNSLPSGCSGAGCGNLTITNSSNPTVNNFALTTTAIRASATGTFSAGFCPLNGQGVTINGTSLTTNATAPSAGTITLIGIPNTSSHITITGPSGSVTYNFASSVSATANQVLLGLTNTATAQNLEAAINANPAQCSNAPSACFGSATVANTSVSASLSTDVVTLTPLCAGAGGSTYTVSTSCNGANCSSTNFSGGSNGANTLTNFAISTSFNTDATNLASAIHRNVGTIGADSTSASNPTTVTATNPGTAGDYPISTSFTAGFAWSPSATALSGGTDGTQTCPSSTSGTFVMPNPFSTSGLATNLASAINACNSSFGAVGVTASASSNTVTVTDSKPGAFLSRASTFSGFSWGTVSGNSSGSTTCTGSAPSFTGTFITSSTPSTLATNLAAAINTGTCAANLGINTASASGSTVTIASSTLGTAGNHITVSALNNSSIYAWSGPTAPTDGTNTCVTLPTATFAIGSTLTTLASNLATAINACPSTSGVTASPSGSGVTLTARTAGTGGNSIGTTTNLSGFAWGGTTLASGSDGSNTGTNFQFWSVNAPASTTTVATNLAAAIQRNGATVGVGSTSSANVVTVTAATLGTAGNTIALSEFISSGFTWSGATLGGGANGLDTGANFSISSSTTAEATNLALAINRNGATVGVSAVSSGAGVTVTATTSGVAGNSITLAEGLGNFTWGGATLAGGVDGQSTVVAFNNLYSNYPAGGLCGFAPTVKWAYNTTRATTTNGIGNSPVLSLDGKKVAWVENTTPLTFHVLTIGTTGDNGSSVLGPVIPCTIITDGVSSSTCHGNNPANNNAVDVRVTLGTAPNDRHSSVFVDYTNDVGYVGPDDGNLYKVTGVFTGAPTLAGAPFPLQVSLTSNGKVLTSPVLDSITQRIFIGTGDGLIKMVRLSASDPCTGAVPAPCVDTMVANLNSTGSHAIIDPPIVESVNGSLFVFLNDNGAQNFALMQADTSLSLASQVIVTAGANTGQPAHAGALDNAYLSWPGTGANTGHLYWCGTGGNANPQLWDIGFTGGRMNSSPANGPLALASNTNSCSPVTEFFNPNIGSGGADMLFVSVQNGCSGTISGGCMRAFDITSGFPASTTGAGVSTVAETGGTSGIVVDNVGNTTTFPQASSLYFSNLSNTTCTGVAGGACAIKLTQSGLQ